MVRITPELLARAPERINPFGDRELILRGLGIPAIENTGVANDQFQCVDLSDNEISSLGGFSLMKRVRTLLLHNNPISTVSVNIGRTLPFLSHLAMSDNKLEMLAEFDRLAGLKHLETLVLTGNPVTQKPHYRLYAIYKIPSLQVLDYQRVRLKERREAKKKFDSSVGQKFEETIRAAAANAPAQQQAKKEQEQQTALPADALERRKAIEKAIKEAKTMEEIEKLQAMLDMGVVPTAPATIQNETTVAAAETSKKELEPPKEESKKRKAAEVTDNSTTEDSKKQKAVEEGVKTRTSRRKA